MNKIAPVICARSQITRIRCIVIPRRYKYTPAYYCGSLCTAEHNTLSKPNWKDEPRHLPSQKRGNYACMMRNEPPTPTMALALCVTLIKSNYFCTGVCISVLVPSVPIAPREELFSYINFFSLDFGRLRACGLDALGAGLQMWGSQKRASERCAANLRSRSWPRTLRLWISAGRAPVTRVHT